MTTWLGWLLGDFGYRPDAPKMDAAAMELAREFTKRIRRRQALAKLDPVKGSSLDETLETVRKASVSPVESNPYVG